MISMSEEIGKVSAALVSAQAEVDNAVKNKKNPHFQNDYADLESVLFTVKPILAKHGLSVVQFPGYEDGICTLSTLVLHKSGEWLQSEAGAPLDRPTAWSVGSCVTYLRRYSLVSITQIAQEDDDGSAASEPSSPKPTKATKPTKKVAAKKLTKKERAAKDWNSAEHLAEALDTLSALIDACEEHGEVNHTHLEAAKAVISAEGPLDRVELAIKFLEKEIGR
jgi:hypothetical protein